MANDPVDTAAGATPTAGTATVGAVWAAAYCVKAREVSTIPNKAQATCPSFHFEGNGAKLDVGLGLPDKLNSLTLGKFDTM